MELLAITAQLAIANGTVLTEGTVPGLAAQPAPSRVIRGRERDYLFAHLALSGPPEDKDALAGELIEGLAQRFFAAPGSVTSALRRAVIDTNDQLLRRNLAAKTPHEGALSCAVLHGAELFTLQVGEGLAFLGHNFGIERLPARPPQHLTPLGRSAGLDIRFAYHQLQSGDMMLFCDPRLAHLSGDSLNDVLVDTEIESGLEALLDLVTGDTARLLLVEFADELPSTLPFTFQHSRQPAPKPSAKPTPAVAGATTAGRAASPTPTGRPSPALPATTAPAGAVPADDGTATLEIGARRVASTSARGLSRFTAWLAAAIGRLSDKQADEPAVHWAIPAAIALIVPIVIAAVVTSVYVQRDTVAEMALIKQQMVDEMLAADNVGGNSAEAQPHYLAVISLAATAEALREDDFEVAGMRSDALDALDRIDGVTRLTASVMYEYEDGADLARMALRGSAGGIAVLDRSANRVLFHATDSTFRNLTDEQPTTIGFGGQAVGAQTMGELFDVIWLPGSASETRDNIAMIDRGGALFNYYPNLGDIGGVTLANGSGWQDPVAMATYLDRLYVLDSGAGQIWKFYIANGYTQFAGDEAIFFSGDAELNSAVDFDLYAEDGSLVVLYGDGRIRYYDTRSGRVRWDETTLAQGGLTTPLVAPVAVKMVGSGLNASIFVLDPGSGRLLQLSRGGTVLTQYRIMDEAGDEVLTGAMDFAVTESPLSVLVVAGNRIYLAENN